MKHLAELLCQKRNTHTHTSICHLPALRPSDCRCSLSGLVSKIPFFYFDRMDDVVFLFKYLLIPSKRKNKSDLTERMTGRQIRQIDGRRTRIDGDRRLSSARFSLVLQLNQTIRSSVRLTHVRERTDRRRRSDISLQIFDVLSPFLQIASGKRERERRDGLRYPTLSQRCR